MDRMRGRASARASARAMAPRRMRSSCRWESLDISERLSGSQRGRKLAVTQRSDHIMNCRLLVIIVVLTVVAVNAQKAARIGPDGKPLLNRPDLEECEKRK